MYLSYDEYTELGGTLDETTFKDYEYDAESEINWYTFNRLKRPEWSDALNSDDLKRCVYQLIRIKQIEDEMIASSSGGIGVGVGWKKEPGIIRQSNDGVTVEYNTLSSGELLSYFQGGKNKQQFVCRYLGNIVNDLGRNLLYRGLYPGE